MQTESAPHSAALRRYRHSEISRIYLVTTATEGRERVFAKPLHARLVTTAFNYFARTGRVYPYAWVVMPDHIHWLFLLRAGTLSSVMSRMKSWTAMQVNRARKTKGSRVWQPGFHDRIVHENEDIEGLIKYVIENPLRWKLVARPGDYPFLYAQSEVLGISGPLIPDPD